MKNTNTKEYKTAIRSYILDNLGCSLDEAFTRYESEYNNQFNKKQYPNEANRLENYLMGLPFDFPYFNDDIKRDIASIHSVPEEEVKERFINNYFNHIATHMLRMKGDK